MSSSTNNQRGGGIGFVGLLTIVFITLKLTNYIDWTWWWVLSPIWIMLCVMLVIIVIAIIIAFLKR